MKRTSSILASRPGGHLPPDFSHNRFRTIKRIIDRFRCVLNGKSYAQ
jgi:hypothetical protein